MKKVVKSDNFKFAILVIMFTFLIIEAVTGNFSYAIGELLMDFSNVIFEIGYHLAFL